MPVNDASYVAGVRREVDGMARGIGLSEEDRGRTSLVVTELATNLARHAGGGEILARIVSREEMSGIEVIAVDRGPGIANIRESLRDGISTAGTAGTGLGAIRRQSDEFDIHSVPGHGTVILSCLWPSHHAPPHGDMQIGSVSVPKLGEVVCGDSLGVQRSSNSISAMVVDGLGHGVLANDAAEAARRLFCAAFPPSPAAAVQKIHAGLRATRGAAVGIVTLDLATSRATFCGIGNIAGLAAAGGDVRRFVSMNGIAGHTAGQTREFVYPCEGAGLVIVLHSDGISSNWSFDRYSGLTARHPSLIAAVLLRDHGRGRDDATVLVIKRPR
ncbi:ATP-binding protein [Reyranella sp.]|uniref:ATP-binding protein n=1 Tax=Reyranella sp. TaxID=1929291 RepID=UPI003BA890D5